MSNIEKLAEIVGGKAEIARMCGVTRSIITRYDNAGGELPVRFRAPIMAALRENINKRYTEADRHRAYQEAVACLPAAVCPCCGQSIEGRVV